MPAAWRPTRWWTFAVVAALALAAPRVAAAHPGAGIVVTRGGVVYFVVIGRSEIHRIDEQGRVSALVTDERLGLPHHLALDADDHIYTISDAQRILWRVSPGGSVAQVMRTNIGTWGDPFAIDSAGNLYSVTEQERSRIVRIEPDGSQRVFSGVGEGHVDGPADRARFGNLHFATMHVAPGGVLYVTDRTYLRAVAADGSVSTIVTPGVELGIATGVTSRGDELFVADYGARRVVRIAGGAAAVVSGSEGLRAVGVATGPAGALLVLESTGMATCVWEVAGGRPDKRACVREGNLAVFLGLFALVAALALAMVLRPPPRLASWLIGVLFLGLATAMCLQFATAMRLDAVRPLFAGLFVAAVVIPLWERMRGRPTPPVPSK